MERSRNVENEKNMMYSLYLKRPLDFILAFCGIILFSPIFLILIIIGVVKMKGNPFHTQLLVGKGEKRFRIIKFRTMGCKMDLNDNQQLYEQILTSYGKFLRFTSLDKLPVLLNILKGDMAFVGPRPLQVCDMVFMTSEQRKRYTIRQGLTGLAQVCGHNEMLWEDKLDYDLRYVKNISFMTDFFIIIKTILRFNRKIEKEINLGDYLLSKGKIDRNKYNDLQEKAKQLDK